MRLFVLVVVVLIPLNLMAQKKNKKGDYDDYWKQQEQLELFDKQVKSAHQLFQEGKLKMALTSYEEALILKPEDQKTIAKIRDIKILLLKEKQRAKTEPVELGKVTLEESKKPQLDTIPKPTKSNVASMDTTVKSISNDTLIKVKKAIPADTSKAPISSKSTAPATPPTKPADKPYKNTENFRKYLATLYPVGWTEEKYKEGNKQMVKRVNIVGDHGNEYLKVTHHYGAVFYFKNGLSITYGTWVSETKDMK